MADRVGIGEVGAGSIGIRGALMHCRCPTYRTASAWPPSATVPGRARAAERYGVAAAEPRAWRTLVDAVTICSPIGLHYEQAMAAWAGIHVHLNKTMTTTVGRPTPSSSAPRIRGSTSWRRRDAPPITGASVGWCRGRWGPRCGRGGRLHRTYPLDEPVRHGDDVLSSVDPTWYFRRPRWAQYDVTVYALHNLTGIWGRRAG